MSNSSEPKLTVRNPASLQTPAPRQKMHSRRGSSAAPYAPRRTQAERSETTRKQLLNAAAKLIRQKGFAGLRTIEVANVAGVPLWSASQAGEVAGIQRLEHENDREPLVSLDFVLDLPPHHVGGDVHGEPHFVLPSLLPAPFSGA